MTTECEKYTMKKTSKKNLFMSKIESKIISGEWPVGMKLPPERNLVEQLGASRTVVNAGLSELAQKGFLEINPRKWTKVADFTRTGTIAVMESIMKYHGDFMDFAILKGVLESRMLVESETASLAAINRSEDDIRCLEDICSMEKTAEDINERVRLDHMFHHAIAVAGGNPVYPLLLNSFAPMADKLLITFYSHLDTPGKVVEYHERIISFIKEKNASMAVATTREMLQHGADLILDMERNHKNA